MPRLPSSDTVSSTQSPWVQLMSDTDSAPRSSRGTMKSLGAGSEGQASWPMDGGAAMWRWVTTSVADEEALQPVGSSRG